MTGLVRKATLLIGCGLILAGAAMAGIPNASNSTLGNVHAVDFDNVYAGASAPAGHGFGVSTYLTTTCIRDVDNFPVPFATVTCDFSACGLDVEMAEIQPDPDVTVDCAARTITKTADASGCIILGPFLARTEANSGPFFVSGWPDAPGDTPSRNIGPATPLTSCVSIYAGGYLMGTTQVFLNRFDNQLDLDVDAGDQSFHINAQGQFLSGGIVPNPPYRIFYDLDGDQDVDAGDGGLMLRAQGRYFGGLNVYNGNWCP